MVDVNILHAVFIINVTWYKAIGCALFERLHVRDIQVWIKCGGGEHHSQEMTREIKEIIALM